MLITSAIISGLGLGSMYGLIALGFHVTYVVSNTVNFSQGSAMMLGAVLGYTFAVTLGWPVFLAVALSLTICALFGLVVERALVRPFADRGSNAWLMATVAGGIGCAQMRAVGSVACSGSNPRTASIHDLCTTDK